MGRERAPIVPFLIFTIICLLGAVWLAMALGNIPLRSDRVSYSAEFDDVTGLIVNDNVKISGVTVGKVTAIEVADGGHARVTFTVDRDVPVPADSEIVVRWRDTFGLRYLYVEPGEAAPVEAPYAFPREQTSAPTDIGRFLQNITPFIDALDPGLQNEVLEALTASVVGRETEIREIVADGADLTEALASRDEELGRLLDNAQTILDAYSNRDEDLQGLLDSFVDVTEVLARRNDTIVRAIDSLADVQVEVGELVENNEDNLRVVLDDLEVLAAALADNRDNLENAIVRGGSGLAIYHRVSRVGQWFNVRGTGLSLDYTTLATERGAEIPPRQDTSSGAAASSNAVSLFMAPLTSEGMR